MRTPWIQIYFLACVHHLFHFSLFTDANTERRNITTEMYQTEINLFFHCVDFVSEEKNRTAKSKMVLEFEQKQQSATPSLMLPGVQFVSWPHIHHTIDDLNNYSIVDRQFELDGTKSTADFRLITNRCN